MPLCEMCGKESRLIVANVEGGDLKVCPNCVKYGQVKKSSLQAKNVPFKHKNIISKQKQQEFKVVDNYSQLIKSTRDARKMNQEEFSKFINERESVLNKWENGSLKPRLDIARKLEKKLNISLVEKEEVKSVEMEKKKSGEGFTLGDFIKVRKKH